MSLNLYRINLINTRVYFQSKLEVRRWLRSNPGECQSWEKVDAVERLQELEEELRASEESVSLLNRRLQER